MSITDKPLIADRSRVLSSGLIPLDTNHINLHTALLTYAMLECVAVISSAYISSIIYHFLVWQTPANVAEYAASAIIIAAFILLISAILQNFSAIQKQPRHAFLWKALLTVMLAFPMFLTVLFFTHFAGFYSRGTFAVQLLAITITVVTARMLFYSWIQHAIASHQIQARRVFLIGDEPHIEQLINRLKIIGIYTVGVFSLKALRHFQLRDSNLGKLISQLRSFSVDDIIIVANTRKIAAVLDIANELSELPTGVHIVPINAVNALAGAQISDFGNLRTVELYRRPLSKIDQFIKRTFDLIAAAVALTLLSPLLLVVSIAIKLESPGPIIFKQRRHGFNNQIIRVFKFRSMTSIEDGDQFTQAVENDFSSDAPWSYHTWD